MSTETADPIALKKLIWPTLAHEKGDRKVIYNVWDGKSVETSDRKLLAFICLAFFLTRTPCRIITVSETKKRLETLWGEIRSTRESAVYQLPLTEFPPYKYHRVPSDNQVCPRSYIAGVVASREKIDDVQGHFVKKFEVPNTLFVCDGENPLMDDYLICASAWADVVVRLI